MTTINDLIKRKEQELSSIAGRKKALKRDGDAANDRGDYVTARRCLSDVRDLQDKEDVILRELTDLKAERIADERADALARQSHPTEAGRALAAKETAMTGRAYVTSPRTYTADAERTGERSFLRDLFGAQVTGDPEAWGRLTRHGEEVRGEQPQAYARAVSTGGVGALVPPQYLAEMWAEYLRAGRPTANLCTRVPLPAEGLSIAVPRITTASTTAVQASENTTLSNTDLDETTLTVPVGTIAGYSDLSRQAIERGQLVESVAFADLAADYATKLDQQVLYGTGSSGQHTGLLTQSGTNSVTYTDASPTLAELWPKLADAVGRITSSRFTGPTAIVMRPNTWAWMLSTLGTDNRPLINAGESGPMNAIGTATATDYAAPAVGQVLGVPVVLDGNIPANLGAGTNETAIIVADFRDCLLFEDNAGAPVQMRFDAPGAHTGTVRLVVWGYSAFTAGRQPAAVSKLTGTGMIIPAL